ncbi:bifunctional riboflavin kinase/FAD synthetase [Helicobacter kayseriensis]|uniref:bifunctional riboflavin kinase/FAD synthetase n=1 Tax=Helicobacter kayseriensis TaxID=2905877 RepID=UPI001E5EC9E1|nr:bifunctional riboflavin kinase/FAD synthetase [Helicobacter kayseriensis]MCE3046747.1 bifunctional riboflavin kinase/FAD synthetase [Helicobacter kayseriensis]MCE3047951.1 bifunctional riboflavin kinase/FAD synthetase [Helicobacter kayseriensis]
MKSISSISPSEITSLCIGKFDGVHIAHQMLLKQNDRNGGVLKIVMDVPPFLTPCQEDYISCPIFRIDLKEIKEMGASDFSLFLKQRFPKLAKIIVGYDFRFGKNRSYGIDDLRAFFEVCVVDEVKVGGVSVHKQKIISHLLAGEILEANAMLGRRYEIKGHIIRGQGIGSKECVPTLNLEVRDYALPKSGVYATLSEVDGVVYKSVSFLGHRLSSDGQYAIETHLLDACIVPKVQEVRISFVDFIRENKRFEALELLKEQIQRDIEQSRLLLSRF